MLTTNLQHNNILNPTTVLEIDLVNNDTSRQSVVYEQLPQVYKNELDNLVSELLDPSQGHIAVVGTPQSGKTFLINLLINNIDRYLKKLNCNKMHFVRISSDTLEQIMSFPRRYSTYINAVTETLQCQERDICFITEEPIVAAKLFGFPHKSHIIMETNHNNFMGIHQLEQQGITKIWSSWSFTDTVELSLKRTELVNLLHLALNKQIQETFNIDVTKKLITRFVSYAIRQTPELVSREEGRKGLIYPPIGAWMMAIRRLGGILALSESPEYRNRNNEVIVSRIIGNVFNELQDELVSYIPGVAEDESLSAVMLRGPEGESIGIALPSNLLAALGQSVNAGSDKNDNHEKTPIVFNDMSKLQQILTNEVMGQDSAVQSLINGLVVPAAGLNDSQKPLRSLLFLGPTGVGKTKMALTLAENIAEEPFHVVRIDMSEYSQPHEAAKLLGAPPGYTGFEQGGVLTNAVRENPKSVVLLDEIEKAHPKIWDSFLQILDAGRMTDGMGQTVDFTQCIIIMTSNLGATDLMKPSTGFNFSTDNEAYTQRQKNAKNIVMKAVEAEFRPELINRLDEIVVFNELSTDTARKIVMKEIEILAERMATNGYSLATISDDILQELLAKSDVSKYGAREIQRVVLKHVSNPVAHSMVKRNHSDNKNKEIVLSFDKSTKTISVDDY